MPFPAGGRGSGSKGYRIFVAKIPPTVTEQEVSDYFSEIGVLDDVYMPRDKMDRQRSHRGFAFVTFKDLSAKNEALQQEHSIGGAPVTVDEPVPRMGQQREYRDYGYPPPEEDVGYAPREYPTLPRKRPPSNISFDRPTTRLFIENLSPQTTERELHEYFSQWGYILSATLPRSKDTNSRYFAGFAIVQFETEASLQRVLSHGQHDFQGYILQLSGIVPQTSMPTERREFENASNYFAQQY